MDTRICLKCGTEKPIDQFPFRDKTHIKRRPYCRSCHNADIAVRAKAHPEKERARHAAYYKANAEKVLARTAAWGKAHPEKRRASCKKWRETHPGAQYVAKRAWEQSHPAEVKAMDARKRARRRNVTINDLTAAQFTEICKAFDFRCAYCLPTCKACRNKTHKLTQDHITATSKGGDHTLHNIVPACARCNARKKDRHVPIPVQPLLLTIAEPRPLKKRKKRS